MELLKEILDQLELKQSCITTDKEYGPLFSILFSAGKPTKNALEEALESLTSEQKTALLEGIRGEKCDDNIHEGSEKVYRTSGFDCLVEHRLRQQGIPYKQLLDYGFLEDDGKPKEKKSKEQKQAEEDIESLILSLEVALERSLKKDSAKKEQELRKEQEASDRKNAVELPRKLEKAFKRSRDSFLPNFKEIIQILKDATSLQDKTLKQKTSQNIIEIFGLKLSKYSDNNFNIFLKEYKKNDGNLRVLFAIMSKCGEKAISDKRLVSTLRAMDDKQYNEIKDEVRKFLENKVNKSEKPLMYARMGRINNLIVKADFERGEERREREKCDTKKPPLPRIQSEPIVVKEKEKTGKQQQPTLQRASSAPTKLTRVESYSVEEKKDGQQPSPSSSVTAYLTSNGFKAKEKRCAVPGVVPGTTTTSEKEGPQPQKEQPVPAR